MILYLLNPRAHIRKAFLRSAVVSKDDALGASVVRLSNCLKPFLASRVPDLHTYALTVQVDYFFLEVNTYR